MFRPRLYRVSLCSVILLHLAAAAIAPLPLSNPRRLDLWWLVFLLGSLLISQPTLLGAWAGLSARPWRIRIPLACGLATTSFLLVATSLHVIDQSLDLSTFMIAAGTVMCALGGAFGACTSFRENSTGKS